MINILSLPSSVATNDKIFVPSVLVGAVSIEVKDEQKVYKDLSMQLVTLETTLDYSLQRVKEIEVMAKQMMIAIDEKKELLMRCDWLVTMLEVKIGMESISSLEDVKSARTKLSRVQTCQLKRQLMEQLAQKEEQLESVEVVLSSKDALVEVIFETGNETFINLGTAGREFVLEKVLSEQPSVELAIAKAEAIEAQVQAAKQSANVEELRAKLVPLPLANLANVPAEYEQEVLQKLLDQPTWNGLFNLDLLIRQYTVQVEKLHNPVQEGIFDTLVLDDKVIERLGVQQVQA